MMKKIVVTMLIFCAMLCLFMTGCGTNPTKQVVGEYYYADVEEVDVNAPVLVFYEDGSGMYDDSEMTWELIHDGKAVDVAYYKYGYEAFEPSHLQFDIVDDGLDGNSYGFRSFKKIK